MTTTTTAHPFLSDAEAAADPDAWARRFGWDLGQEPDTYESSVLSSAWIDAEQRGLLLNDVQLRRLLAAHGASLTEYLGACHPCLSPNHAGQALSWLGY